MISIQPTELDVEIAAWFEVTLEKTPACENTLEELLSAPHELFAIYAYGVRLGAIMIMWIENRGKKYLNPVLLGGENMKLWHRALKDWCIEYGRKHNAYSIMYVSRKGWDKIYPEDKVIGKIYEYRL